MDGWMDGHFLEQIGFDKDFSTLFLTVTAIIRIIQVTYDSVHKRYQLGIVRPLTSETIHTVSKNVIKTCVFVGIAD